MGGHAGLHKYMKARQEEKEKERLAEIDKTMVKEEITNFLCKRCGTRLKTWNTYYRRCPNCALMHKREGTA